MDRHAPGPPVEDNTVESADELTALRTRILAVPFLRALPPALRDRFAMIILWISIVRSIKEGDELYAEGGHDDTGGCMLLDGRAEVIRTGLETEIVPAPSLFGEIQQFTEDRRRTATVRLLESGRALTSSWEDLAEIARDVFTKEEHNVVSILLKQMAWGRCAELFDQAAGSTRGTRNG